MSKALLTYYVVAFHVAGFTWCWEWLAGAMLTVVVTGGLVADLQASAR